MANGAQTHSLNQYIRNCAEMADAKTRRGISRTDAHKLWHFAVLQTPPANAVHPNNLAAV